MTTADPVDRAVARLTQAEATVSKCKAELATAELNLAAVKNASVPELLDDPTKAEDVANARLLAAAVVETGRDMLTASELDRENAARTLAEARADKINTQTLPLARAALEAWEARETELIEQLMAHGGTHPDDLPNATRTVERLRGLWREACQRNSGRTPLGQPSNLFDLLDRIRKLEAEVLQLRPAMREPEATKMTDGQVILAVPGASVGFMESVGWHVATAEEVDRAQKGVRITDPQLRDLVGVRLPDTATESPGSYDDVFAIGLPPIGVAGE